MSSKRRQLRQSAERASQERGGRWLQAAVLGGSAALVVIGSLVPSEAAISDGTYAPIAAGWCVLLVLWAAAQWLVPTPSLRLGWTEVALAALVSWHALAALVSLGSVNGRQALNALWLFLGYGLTVFLLKQSLRTLLQARAIVTAMIWLATLLASLGLFQYAYSMPRLRAQYAADPRQVLADNLIEVAEDSPQRALFENRLQSVEPLATFALTNSLAGFLAPWLVCTGALALAFFFERGQRWPLVGLACAAVLMAICLLLTKSRTAYLAALGGLALVALYGRRGGWRIDWRIPAALGGLLLMIGLSAVAAGGLDVEVLSEAPLSVRYRVEYWQATARMIGDYPLLGIGPGNFQEAYTAYKLPHASETVKDPHNFLLEIWATAGTPALALLLLVAVAFLVDLSAAARDENMATEGGEKPLDPAVVGWGAAAGLMLAAPVAALVDYPLESLGGIPVAWFVGIPLGAGAWWALKPWIAAGPLTLAAVWIPQIVLLVNLLAAGALTFPGVMGTLLVLLPVSCVVAGQPLGRTLSRTNVAALSLAVTILAAACLLTEYLPVLQGRLAVAQALDLLQLGEAQQAEERAAAASRADPLSPEPWRLLAELRLSQWLTMDTEPDRQAFDAAANEYRRRDPQHHVAAWARGNWYLTAWRKSQREEDLSEALSAYTQASILYPQRALYHAQLAWVLHLAGKDDLAAQAAEKALALDAQMPHQEQKLGRQRVIDPQLSPAGAKLPREETAEQTVQRLRKTAVHNTGEESP